MKKHLSLPLLLLFLATQSSYAAIVEISAPASVAMNILESDTSIYLFDEQQNFTLTNDLLVDQLTSTSTSGSIGSGTTVNSHLLHYDAVGTGVKGTSLAVAASGSYTFDTQILGVIWGGAAYGADKPPSSLYIDLSDYLGNPGTFYPTGEYGRGLEEDAFYAVDGTQDFFNISEDLRTLSVDLAVYPSYADQLRVITAVPVPAAVWLFGSGLIGIFGFSKKRKS